MIYVGPLIEARKSMPRAVQARGRACRVIADTTEELTALARRLGLDQGPMQRRPWPHYWLTPWYRKTLVGMGATELSERELAEKARRLYREPVRRPL